MQSNLIQRKQTRLTQYDYSADGGYFITICTKGRRKILSTIKVGDDVHDVPKGVELLPCGTIVDGYVKQLNDFYDNLNVDLYVIMPNHVHFLLIVTNNGASGTSHPTTKQHKTVSQFVSTFKRFCNKQLGENIWQRSFYDHIIRDRKDYEQIAKYICENPLKWHLDELYCE